MSFNLYEICYARSAQDQQKYIQYIDEQYNSERLTNILSKVTHTIGANILNIAKQDYEPQGASVTMLISEGEIPVYAIDPSCNSGILIPEHIVGHLDKSHVTVHTYPESHPLDGVSTFRVDIDVSTCGRISPLKALNFLIESFDSDIINIDYRVRGFTRDVDGKKHFIDHSINSIQNFIGEKNKKRFNMVDVNVYQDNIFHTKMMLKNLILEDYLFEINPKDLPVEEVKTIKEKLKLEMLEIFYGKNFENYDTEWTDED
ncbi:MAG: adenosylmethionine decarboxylase [Vallitaleaceae bacterium]|nr:adenosylmethionine decarboxylase [Vallitaleaceae bacterium]